MTSGFLRDLFERVARTYLQAFGALLLASGFGADGVVDLSTLTKAAGAAIPAALSLLMGMVARGVGNQESAALFDPVPAPAARTSSIGGFAETEPGC